MGTEVQWDHRSPLHRRQRLASPGPLLPGGATSPGCSRRHVCAISAWTTEHLWAGPPAPDACHRGRAGSPGLFQASEPAVASPTTPSSDVADHRCGPCHSAGTRGRLGRTRPDGTGVCALRGIRQVKGARQRCTETSTRAQQTPQGSVMTYSRRLHGFLRNRNGHFVFRSLSAMWGGNSYFHSLTGEGDDHQGEICSALSHDLSKALKIFCNPWVSWLSLFKR